MSGQLEGSAILQDCSSAWHLNTRFIESTFDNQPNYVPFMFSQWCFKIKKSLKKQRLRNGSATESIYRSPWELHTSARSQLRCCIYHAGLANWHDDEGSSLLLSSRPPQYVQRSGAPHQPPVIHYVVF